MSTTPIVNQSVYPQHQPEPTFDRPRGGYRCAGPALRRGIVEYAVTGISDWQDRRP